MENRKILYLVLIAMAHLMNHLYQLLIPITIFQIAEEYLLSTFIAGVIISSYNLSYALFQTPFGFISKILGLKNTVILGLVITSTFFLILGFIKDLSLFAVVLFVAGVGGSTYHPNGMPLLSEFYEKDRGQVAGFHQIGGSLGSIIAPLVIAPLVLLLNWRLAIIILAIPGIILSLILWFLLKEPKQLIKTTTNLAEGLVKKSKTNLKMYNPSLLLVLASVVYTIGIRGIDSMGLLYLQSGRKIMNLLEATTLFSLFKIPGLFSAPLCGKLSDIFGRKKTITVLVCIEAVSLYALTVVSVSLLIAPCFIFGFASFGLLAISDAYLTDITSREYMSTVFGLNFTLSYFTQVLIPPIFGGIVDFTKSFDICFVALSAIIPLSLPILSKVKVKSQI